MVGIGEDLFEKVEEEETEERPKADGQRRLTMSERFG